MKKFFQNNGIYIGQIVMVIINFYFHSVTVFEGNTHIRIRLVKNAWLAERDLDLLSWVNPASVVRWYCRDDRGRVVSGTTTSAATCTTQTINNTTKPYKNSFFITAASLPHCEIFHQG